MASQVFVRNVPDDLWRIVKSHAAARGQTLSAAVVEALRAWLLSSAADVPAPPDWNGISRLGHGGRGDVSERHDAYLAEAALRNH
ncbi:MAG: hypothetical protein HY744_22785 [Deltaproteobacteria bacterium]|nr:hypothetical protein [Deltaproteobacteria bacterium]